MDHGAAVADAVSPFVEMLKSDEISRLLPHVATALLNVASGLPFAAPACTALLGLFKMIQASVEPHMPCSPAERIHLRVWITRGVILRVFFICCRLPVSTLAL